MTTASSRATLDELLQVLLDGIAFFGDAADHSRHPGHAQLFRDLRQSKQKIADDLRAVAPLGSDPPTRSTFTMGLLQGYTDLRARLADDPDEPYARALEAQEDRILTAFHDAVNHGAPGPVRDIARAHLGQVQRMHDLLKALKDQYPQ
jgi:uncharacterized protein (TIGR02284 family)